jgi:uncharacterized membrane protein
MTIANVAISNTFNEFRVTTNEVITEVNKLSDGTATIIVDTSTANSYIGSGASLTSLNASSISSGTLDSTRLPASGVTANTYGSASQVPVLVIDEYGRVTSAANVNVAGVTSLQFHTANGEIQIDTADGGIFTANVTLDSFDTDDLAEGSANLYYTDTRARSAVSNGIGLLYDSTNGVFDLANTTVSANTYGSASQVPVLVIDAQGRVTSAANVNVAGVSAFQYHSANAQLQIDTADGGLFTANVDLVAFDTDDLAEGSANLYYTDARARSAVSNGVGLLYDSTNGIFDLANTTVTSGAYGSASQVPVLVIDDQGRVTSAANVNVAGVSSFQYHSANAQLQIDTADGGIFTANVDLVAFDTDDLAEGSANLYYTDVRARGAISVNDTGGDGSLTYDSANGIIEYTGPSATEVRAHISVNDTGGDGSLTYDSANGIIEYTGPSATEVRSHISVNDTGGDGSLTYDSANGIIEYTGPSAAEVRAHFSGGTGVGISNGAISIGQDVGTSSNVTFNKVTVSTAPLASTDLTNKSYVDEVAEGLKTKPAVEIATTGNLTATYDNGTLGVGATLTANTNGAFPEIDGVTLSSTTPGQNGVLVKNQTISAHNGRYNLTTVGNGSNPWVLTRCGLCDEADEIPGAYVFVKTGTLYAGTGWVQTVDDPATFVVGSNNILVTQFSGAGTFSAGTGLNLNGTQFSLADTAVSANTYGNAATVAQFTVDAQGRLTNAANVAIAIASGAVSGLAASATTDTTNANNISSGTLNAARLAVSGVTLGTYGTASSVSQVVVDDKGRVTSAANVTIAIASGAVSGLAASATTDTTNANNISSGTLSADRLATSGVAAGTYGVAASVPQIVVDNKGRVTSAANVAIAIASGAVSGLAASATTDTTNADNISSGTLNAARLANSGAAAGTYGIAASVPQIVVDAKGRVTSAANVAIAIASGAVSGLAASATTDTTNADNISSGTLNAARLATSGVSANTYGSAATVAQFTVDNKGRVTSAANVTIAIASGAVSGLAASATTDTTNADNISSGTLNAARLATSGVAAGTYGVAASVPQIVVDNKGRVTSAANVAIAIASGAVSGLAASATTDTTNASNISSGTLPGDRGVTSGSASSSFVEYNGTTATAGQFDGGSTTPSGTTRLNYGGYLYATRFYGDGSNLTALNATQVTSGTLPGDRGVTSGSASSSFVEYNGTTATSGQFDGGSTTPSGTTRLNYGGYLYATRFYGDGSNLTALNATQVTSGTLPGDRGVTSGSASSSFVEYNGTTKTSGQFDGGSSAPTNTTRLNYDGNFYATNFFGNGSNLTALNANNITTGTLPGDRGVTSGSSVSSFVEYNGTTATAGQFDGGTTDPSGTTRLNYGGYLYATRFYGDGSNLTNLPASADTFARTIALMGL